MLSARNLRHTKVVNSFGLNIYDLLYHDNWCFRATAATELEQLLGRARRRRRIEAGAGSRREEAPAKPKRTRKAEAEEAA